MGQEMVTYFADLFRQIEIPRNDTLDREGFIDYEAGLNLLLTYRGHPDVLVEALKRFLDSGIRPYALTGMALVMRHASFMSGDQYDDEGLDLALNYWKRARMIAENRFEIDLFGTWIYNSAKQPDTVRQILDRYKGKFDQNFWYALAESTYWSKTDEQKCEQWRRVAYKAAKNDTQRLYVLNVAASNELSKPGYGNAVALYRKVTEIDPKDPWAWHNLSYVYVNTDRLDEAEECNRRALAIMDFGVARKIQDIIARKRAETASGTSPKPNNKQQPKKSGGGLFGRRRDQS